MSGNDSFTKILLHMDGANGGATFIDVNSGGSAHTWAATGATNTTSFAKFGPTAGAFLGSQYIDTVTSSDFTLGSGDWTVDFWFSVAGGAGTNRYFCGQENAAGAAVNETIGAFLNASNVVSIEAYVGGVASRAAGTTVLTTTGLHHYEACRFGSSLLIFLDGVQEGSAAISGSINTSPNNFAVGRIGEFTTLTANAQIDEFRLSVGIARHTSNFTPPIAAYDSGFVPFNPWPQLGPILAS
jgi:hypothetical protein